MSNDQLISSVILEALRTYKSINVPGLGCFQVKQVQQYLGSGKGILLPPTASLQLSDSCPESPDITEVIKTLGVLPDTDMPKFNKAIQKALNDVLNYGVASLDALGELKKTEGGKIILESTPNLFNRNSRYLPILSIEPLPAPLGTEEEENIHGVIQTQISMEEISHRTDKAWHAYIFPVLIIIAVSILFVYFLQKYLGGQEVQSNVVEKVQFSPAVSDPESVLKESLFSSELLSKLDSVQNNKVREESCMVVVGSYSLRENGMKQYQNVKSKGYVPFITQDAPYRVGVRFDCRNQNLPKILVEIQTKVEPEAWILQPAVISPEN